MRFRVMSDLHNEVAMLNLPVGEKEHESVLVLAGDVCNFGKRMTFHGFFQEMCDRFRAVVYVPGNHEYYDTSMMKGHSKFMSLLEMDCYDTQRKMPTNLFVLNDETVEFDDVVVVGSTLWTSFRNGNPVLMNEARFYMNDYVYVRNGGDGYARKLTPEDVFEMNYQSTDFVFGELSKNKGKKVLVVTHHAPSHASVSERFLSEGDANEFYCNHFEYRLEAMGDNAPDVWVHGHIHSRSDYHLGKTRVVCNPRGYVFNQGLTSSVEDSGFDPYFEVVL